MPASLPRWAATVALAVAGPALLAQGPDEDAALRREVAELRAQVHQLGLALAQRDEALGDLQRDVRAVARDLDGLRERLGLALGASLPALPFLSAPPPASDQVGVAQKAVLQPRVEVGSAVRHDIVFLKLARLEAAGPRPVAERELGAADAYVELPLDLSGGLYVLSWSTAEGFDFPLVLRDGLTRQPAATVQVRQLQREGRFVFVGYRTE
jgi:hypothetical protein